MIKQLLRVTAVFLMGSFAARAQQENVLFIGNSFTHMNNLCKIYQNLANSKGQKVFADTLAVSGSSLKQHTERPNTWRKIKSRNWDYVFIQGYSRELSFDSVVIAKESVPYAKMLIDSLQKHSPCVRIYYYMTWGYENGLTSLDSTQVDSYTAMQGRIQRGYMQLSRATGGYPVVPVGMVWEEVRKAYPSMNLYEPDKFHPNPKGSLIAASSFYAAIYKESPVGGKFPAKVDSLTARNIQRIAGSYVLQHYHYYHLDTVQHRRTENYPALNFKVQEKWLSIAVTNKSTKGQAVEWDFGDGTKSNKANPKHYYAKSGRYTVQLSVKYGCEWHTMKKIVTVSDKEKFANTKRGVNGAAVTEKD